MKLSYEKPMLYCEEFATKEYVATCEISVKVPPHTYFKNRTGEQHCAFTSNTCATATEFNGKPHQVITQGSTWTSPQRPDSSKSNCHVLDNQADAENFAKNYSDPYCGAGVAKALGLQKFEEIAKAFS